MATYKLKIDLRNKRAKTIVDFLFNLAKVETSIEIEEETEQLVPNAETRKAIAEAKKRKVKRFKNTNDLINDLLD